MQEGARNPQNVDLTKYVNINAPRGRIRWAILTKFSEFVMGSFTIDRHRGAGRVDQDGVWQAINSITYRFSLA